MTCLNAAAPLGTCGTCRQRLGTVAPGPRLCLSSRAYETDSSRAPIFSRPDQVLWGLKVTKDAALEVIAEADLRHRLASGALSDAVLVSGDFGSSFSTARNALALTEATRHASATSGFVLQQVWAAIEAAPHPPALLVPEIGDLGATPRPVPSGTDRQAEQARRAQICRTAQHAYDELLRLGHQLQQESRFTATRNKLTALRDEYRQLPTREQDEVAEVLRRERARQLSGFLAVCRIETVDIQGVGDKKKAALRASGIYTAGDATQSRVDEVRGFGPELTAAVLAWRRSCESRFAFNPKLADAAQDAVRRQCLSQKRGLEAVLTAGPGELQGVATAQQRLGVSLMSAALALAQAQADLAAVSNFQTRVMNIIKSFPTARVAVVVGFLMTLSSSSTMVNYGILPLWFGAPFVVTGSAFTRLGLGMGLASILTALGDAARPAMPWTPAAPASSATLAPVRTAAADQPSSRQSLSQPSGVQSPRTLLAVWTSVAEGLISIAVTINDRPVGTLTRFLEPGIASSCDAVDGARIVAAVAPGAVTFSGRSDRGATWSGSRNLSDGECISVELTCTGRDCGSAPAPTPTPTPTPDGIPEPLPAPTLTPTPILGGIPESPPPPPPATPVRVGGNIKPPQKTRDVRPVYPPIAQSARVQGIVIIEATISPDGAVTDAKVLRSIPLLDGAALDAVRQWVFTPTLLNGVPVPVIMTVTVQFTLQ